MARADVVQEPLAVDGAQQGWQTAHRSSGAAVAPKQLGCAVLVPVGQNQHPCGAIGKLFGQHSVLAQPFLVFSGQVELLHQDATCGPPRELHCKEGV